MLTANPNLKQLALLQFLLGAAFAGLGVYFSGPRLGASIAFGSGLMLFNLVALGWSWQRLMAKKSIAWTVLIIVIKYAVLLGSVYYFARTDWFSSLGAGLGVASFMFAALVLAAIYHKRE